MLAQALIFRAMQFLGRCNVYPGTLWCIPLPVVASNSLSVFSLTNIYFSEKLLKCSGSRLISRNMHTTYIALYLREKITAKCIHQLVNRKNLLSAISHEVAPCATESTSEQLTGNQKFFQNANKIRSQQHQFGWFGQTCVRWRWKSQDTGAHGEG